MPGHQEASIGTLEVSDLHRTIAEKSLFSKLNLILKPGDRLFVMGPSGIGKSMLLRSIAGLDPVNAGTLTYQGKTPEEWGMPAWRAHVMYVAQSRVNFQGTPAALFDQAQQFNSLRGRTCGSLADVFDQVGLEQRVLKQQWSELSGGQAQRAMLAIAVALQPHVLLLDEPTSACDQASTGLVEALLQRCGCSLLWVTHDAEQAARVGGGLVTLPQGQEQVPVVQSFNLALCDEEGDGAV